MNEGTVAKYLQQPLKTFPSGEGGSRSETDEGPYGTEWSDKAFIEPLCHPTPLFHVGEGFSFCNSPVLTFCEFFTK